MPDIRDMKLVITFAEVIGQPPLLGDEFKQMEGEKPVCAKCPTRAGGLVVDGEVWVDKSINSDPGSKAAESRCKTMGGIAACFHCERWGYQTKENDGAQEV